MNSYNNEEIFNFLNSFDNDMLSQMNGNDLQDFLILLDDFNLKLRDNLGFNQNVTFGLEIEFEKANIDDFDKKFDKFYRNTGWRTAYDLSLSKGLEIDSPIMKDTKENWKDVNNICEIAKSCGIIDKKAGAHVHVGTHVLGSNPQSWLNLLRIWSVYENIIYRFGYGSFLVARPRILEYAKPISRELWETYSIFKDNKDFQGEMVRAMSFRRAQAINFNNVCSSNKFSEGNTIEFRCPNGTLEAIIWQNNVNLFVKLLTSCNSANINNEIVDQRHEMIAGKFDNLKWYDEIFLDQALEFADIVFTNNQDKIYFLKQYLKSFQTCNQKNEYPNEKTLTKKMF